MFFGGYWEMEEKMSNPEYGLNMMVKALPSPLDAEHGENGDFGTIGMDGGFSESTAYGACPPHAAWRI